VIYEGEDDGPTRASWHGRGGTRIAVDALAGWTRNTQAPVYLCYDGNKNLLTEHVGLQYALKECQHYPLANAGMPLVTVL
jgi:hypothetical protein